MACQVGLVLFPTEPAAVTDMPFIHHSYICPLVAFSKRMSYLPSPLKSPVPTTFQVGSVLLPTTPEPITVVPFISHS
jgi:hypothetical protein